jgi:predicted transcriptional regulator
MLLQKDILRGISPKFAEHYQEGVPILWDTLLQSGAEKRLAEPIKGLMSDAKAQLDAEDSLLKASHVMIEEDAYLLPVMEADKLIGVVRMGDIFQQITNALLKL